MGVKLRNWAQAGRRLAMADAALEKTVDSVLQQNAELYRDMVLQLIEEGDPSWPPKSKGAVKRSGSPKLFIGKTGSFYRNIQHRGIRGLRAGRGERQLFVGARYDVKHAPSDMSMAEIAEILQNLPEPGDRDLFGPAWERAEPLIRKNFEKAGRKFRI